MISDRVYRRFLASKPDFRIQWTVKDPLDILDGKQLSWPDVRGWVKEPGRKDAHGAIGDIDYRMDGPPWVSVHFEHFSWGGHQDTWETTISTPFGSKDLKGTWEVKNLASILGKVASEVDAASRETLKRVKGLHYSKWTTYFDEDMDALSFVYENPDQFSDNNMTVDFEEVTAALGGDSQEVRIRFTAGSDYEGSFGEQESEGKWSSLDDIPKTLRKAEGLWTRWSK